MSVRIFGIFKSILRVEGSVKGCVEYVFVCVGVRFCEGL